MSNSGASQWSGWVTQKEFVGVSRKFVRYIAFKILETGWAGCELTWALQSERTINFVSTCSCAPRVFRRASQGPQAARPCSTPPGGARHPRPDLWLRTAGSAAPPGRVPGFTQGRSIIDVLYRYTVRIYPTPYALCVSVSGCEGRGGAGPASRGTYFTLCVFV